jgi:ribonuclease HI
MYQCYTAKCGLYWRIDDEFFPCRKSTTTNFYVIDKSTPVELPQASHPIKARYMTEGRIWVWNSFHPHEFSPPDREEIILDDAFDETPGQLLHIVSDASVHTSVGRVTGAWHLFETRDAKRRVVRSFEHQVHAHSYRAELETFYHALKDADDLLQTSHDITQRMDNEGGIKKLEQPIIRPSQTMDTDMDIVMAYNELREKSKHRISHKWVMGHADEKREKKTDITPFEWENIECDEEADDLVNSMAEKGEKARPFQPLPGYRAILKLGESWVTTHFRKCVEFANTAPEMVDYIVRRLDISLDTFHTINWNAIGKVRRPHGINRIVRTSKMMYGWMPVGHNWQKCKLESDKCPCCGCPDETFEHLLGCKNDKMVHARKEAYTTIQNECDSLNLPAYFTSTLLSMIKVTLEGADPPAVAEQDPLSKAIEAQATIGHYHMVIGFMAKAWTDALADMNIEHPAQMMEQVLAMLWDHICERLWSVRNGIRHSTDSHVTNDEMAQMETKLSWYQRHQDEVLDYRHRFLANFTSEDVGRWTRATRRAKLELLNNARKYYEVECAQQARNQSTIYDWIHSYTVLRSGRIVGDGLVDSWIMGRRPARHADDYDSDTSEFEFEWDGS